MTLDKSIIEQIPKVYKKGYTVLETANILNISEWSVRKYLRLKGIQPRGKRTWTMEKTNDVIYKYLSGYTAKNIANEYGVTLQAIEQLLIVNDVKKRDFEDWELEVLC